MFFDIKSHIWALKSSILVLLLGSSHLSAAELHSNAFNSIDTGSICQNMVDMKPSGHFDYGYISEREIEKIANRSDIDYDLYKKEAIKSEQRMEQVSKLSLLEINDLLGSGSKTFKQSQIPHTHYLGSEVHLHLMHIDYAQTLLKHWDLISKNYQGKSYINGYGQVKDEDVGTYRAVVYQDFCSEKRIGLCMSHFSPALKGMYTLNLYISGIHSSLDINVYDVKYNYNALINYKSQLEHIISHNLLDSRLVGSKEAQEREQRKNQPFTTTYDDGIEIKKKHFTKEQIARIKEAAKSSHSVVLNAKSEDQVDVMVSLDDLPYGYVDSFQKNVKQFKLEYILNNKDNNKSSFEQHDHKIDDFSHSDKESHYKYLKQAQMLAQEKAMALAREQKRIPKPVTDSDIERELSALYDNEKDLVSLDDLAYDIDHYQGLSNKKLNINDLIEHRNKISAQQAFNHEQEHQKALAAAYNNQFALMEAIKAKDLGYDKVHSYNKNSKDNPLSRITKNPIFEKESSSLFKHSVLFRNDKSKCAEQGRLIIGTQDLSKN